ncbi:MAG: efflux RND transporter periplasmic adaptor subunit [Paucibacter sp.]|nr:efflux RND transporter periplasmic adaptor subunit [Roseateles sp.]
MSQASVHRPGKLLTLLVLCWSAGVTLTACSGDNKPAEPSAAKQGGTTPAETTLRTGSNELKAIVNLSENQVKAIKVGAVGLRAFANEEETMGSIDFNQNANVQVFTSYPGKITRTFADVGDAVKAGKPLFTIESPDLMNAEQALVGAAAAFDAADAALTRAKVLLANQGMAQKDFEATEAAQRAADAAYKAGRNEVRVFGKTDAEIDRIIQTRKIETDLVVLAPLSGRVTARNAQPGLLVQPGNAPAPYTVADVSTKWMLAYVPELDAPKYKVGQPVKVLLGAYAGRVFEGTIKVAGESVDPNTHRKMLRAEVKDPRDELSPGMLTSFKATLGAPVQSLAIPVNGVVREGDGTMMVWVTTDRRTFVQRPVEIGVTQDGFHQIVKGLQAGEHVVVDGAVLLSNMLKTGNAS